ncbi:hypothetical protein HW932_00815 [Allochromatium humboldtianum]|uniref:Uncharacterized protein n=1 Tax=Allochromatium humboldtianum TaxID=504901 RepID=A0A850QZT2_9GAMM|nr:hypothetical protein [Allochromatium humboldtianum]NVZ07799.1 hypothetical protein [Allochromatium humboldtianum]
MSASFHQFAYFIWSVADLPCDPYRPLQYEHELVMLPLNMLRCAQAPRRAAAGGDRVNIERAEHGPIVKSMTRPFPKGAI